MIQAGESEGIAGDTYYGYVENLKEKVENAFADFSLPIQKNNIELIKGLYEDTLPKTMHSETEIAFAHIDCDWYESVMVCLDRIVPQLSPGGMLVIDDYDAWSGCKKAVDDYFLDKKDDFAFKHTSRLHI